MHIQFLNSIAPKGQTETTHNSKVEFVL